MKKRHRARQSSVIRRRPSRSPSFIHSTPASTERPPTAKGWDDGSGCAIADADADATRVRRHVRHRSMRWKLLHRIARRHPSSVVIASRETRDPSLRAIRSIAVVRLAIDRSIRAIIVRVIRAIRSVPRRGSSLRDARRRVHRRSSTRRTPRRTRAWRDARASARRRSRGWRTTRG